jgi:hypothetical protein
MRHLPVQILSKYAHTLLLDRRMRVTHSYPTSYSVIAVPGLGSHAIGSWKSPGGSDVWLRDYLPDDVHGIRVLLYGYNTSLLGSDSKDSIEDLGNRFLESIKAFRGDTVRYPRLLHNPITHQAIDGPPSSHIHWPQLRRFAH